MQVMLDKGLVSRGGSVCRSHVYEALLPKEQTQKAVAGDLLRREVFRWLGENLLTGRSPRSRRQRTNWIKFGA